MKKIPDKKTRNFIKYFTLTITAIFGVVIITFIVYHLVFAPKCNLNEWISCCCSYGTRRQCLQNYCGCESIFPTAIEPEWKTNCGPTWE